jgi:phosphatidylglycerol lysyltransferase
VVRNAASTNEFASERRQRLVDTYGYNGLALLTLYDGWRYFEPSDLDGFVAFELHRGTAVACGDPVCAESDLRELMTRFAEYCESRKWRFTFVGASARAGKVAAELGFRAVKIGEEPFFELANYSTSGKGAKKIRSATNLARRTGIVVEEYRTPSPAIDSEIDEIAREWLASRKSPPMGFLLRSRPFAKREKKRIFIATFQGRVVGAMTCSPAPARNMLYVEEQLRRPDAPYGTTELLVEEARTAAKADGRALLSLGTSPLQGAQAQPYGGFRAVKLLVRALFTRANFIYSFRSLNHYKKKFAPSFWEDSFFIYRGSMLAVTVAIATAFSPEGLPSLFLPKRMQWLRFVPTAALWTAALSGVFVTGFAAWEFPVLTLPVREVFEGLALVRFPAGLMVGLTEGTVFAHRIVSTIVLLGVGAAVWQRRARA